ncbi:hypothetical protein Nm8I071_08230 [Nonomuraea sp. TT08I-71]|nr:hypothetical protein Nm8I071_08230 [Nonomuraea sp. TT08I-71]
MPGRLADERVGAGHTGAQVGLDPLQETEHGRLDPRIGEVQAERAELTRALRARTTARAGGT